jgi:hypothetical protein
VRASHVVALGAAAALGLALWAVVGRAGPETGTGAVGARALETVPQLAPLPPLPSPEERSRQRLQLVDKLQLADHTYCSYRASSRYPPGARPMTENADQNRPNEPVLATAPLRQEGGASNERIRLQTSQSRVYLGAGESVVFMLRADAADGRALPLVVTRAIAQGVTATSARAAAQVTIAFADDGVAPDAVAGDGVFSGLLATAQGALAGFDGTIRTEVRYNAGGAGGLVQFDVIHTPDLPAVWTGAVRQALEEGSLNFYLALDVRQAGRYVVSGRVDDARSQPVALLTFNEVLGAGPNEVRLSAFGKLVRDEAAALPLTLRDVDGYLLRERGDPDRALLPRLQGRVVAGTAADAAALSDAEWQSEERSRYLAEFARDLAQARTRLLAFDPETALPPSACAALAPSTARDLQ